MANADSGGNGRAPLDEASGQAREGTLHILLDGRALEVEQGRSVAAALLAAGYRTLRHSALRGEPRGMFCGMGVCFDCVMRIDGRAGVRACQTLVAEGMQVQSR